MKALNRKYRFWLRLLTFTVLTITFGVYHSLASASPDDPLYKPATFLDKALALNYGQNDPGSITTPEKEIHLGKLVIIWVTKIPDDCPVTVEKVNKHNFYLNMNNCQGGLAFVKTERPLLASSCVWRAKNAPELMFEANVWENRVNAWFFLTAELMHVNNFFRLDC